jgi:hydroxyacylglutathione hydrolase
MLGCNCSMLGDETTREAIVVDPGDDVSKIVDILKRHGLTVKMIVITHAHIDHIGGAHKLRAITGAPVYMHRSRQNAERPARRSGRMAGDGNTGRPWHRRTPAHEGDVLRAGSIEAQVLHTPGHTQGSISLYLPYEGKVIAGDTLFEGSIGRTDLPGGDTDQIKRSIREKLYTLPDSTIVFPGHGGPTSIGREKR